MYFWNVKGLKRDLAEGPLAPAASLQYLIAWCVAQSLSYIMSEGPITDPDRAGATQGWLSRLDSLVYLAGTVFGLIHCYRINGGPRGQHFLDRVFSLVWVTSIRFIPPALIAVIVWAVIMVAMHVKVTSLTIMPLGLGIVIVFWWRLGHHLRDVVMAAASRVPETAGFDPRGVR